MIAHLEISNLIEDSNQKLSIIRKLLSIAEPLSVKLLDAGPKQDLSQNSSDLSEVFDAKKMQQIIEENEEIYSNIRDIQRKLSYVNSKVLAIQKISTDDELQQLLQDLEDKCSSLSVEKVEHEDKYSDVCEQQKQLNSELNTLNNERNKISETLEIEAVKKMQFEKEKTAKLLVQKAQVKRARWFLVTSVVGMIAYRISVIGGGA